MKVHFLRTIPRQPTETVERIDRRAQGDTAAKRLFGAPRTQTVKLATVDNVGDSACGVYLEPEIGNAATDDAEIVRGEWDSLEGGNVLYTRAAAKVTCAKCKSAMPRRAS